MRPHFLALLLLAPALSGCLQGFEDTVGGLLGPSYHIQFTPFDEGDWNTHNLFRVRVFSDDPVPARIEAENRATGATLTESVGKDGATRQNDGSWVTEAALELPDGIWDIQYFVDGDRQDTFSDVRIDTTLPEPDGLERVGNAVDGTYTIGAGVQVEAGAEVRLLDGRTGSVVARSLPYTLLSLPDGLHPFLLVIQDEAGNYYNATIQVRSGHAADLPAEGAYTFGVIARYTNTVRLWDISDLEQYLLRSEARDAVGQEWLGSGFGVTPQAEPVQQVVSEVVTSDMNTAETALALFEWLFDNLEYDEARLDENDLLEPTQTIHAGGGVCRDLAATYVSLLRAAGVPARLTSGYLAGNVDGFHAWVEFYGGAVGSQSPWVPVDVSPIDGEYDVFRMMQAFGVLLPDYLALRSLPEGSEIEGWSTSLSVEYEYPADNRPDIRFEKNVDSLFDETGVLCVHDETFARRVAPDREGCSANEYNFILGDSEDGPSFVIRTERLIDYGVEVRQASEDTHVVAEVAYPFPDSVTPNEVVYQFYGKPFTLDEQTGKAVADFTL